MDARLATALLLALLPAGSLGAEPCSPPGLTGAGLAAGLLAVSLGTVLVGALLAVLLMRMRILSLGWTYPPPPKSPKLLPEAPALAPPDDKFAFDNPYFKEEEGDPLNKAEKGLATKNGDAANKHPSRTPLAGFKLARSLLKGVRRSAGDDTAVGASTVTVVPMQGRDFTGLGFTICGNMRDGIFVKDVLPRGPAGESGSVKPGDKLLSLTISLAHVVLEDALSLLSYASPYELQIEVESTPGAKKSVKSPCTHDSRLCHPLYRSQSSGDLQCVRGSVKTATPRQSPMLVPALLVKSTSKKSDRSKASQETTPPPALPRTSSKGMDIPDVVQSAPVCESPEPEPPQVIPRTKGTPGKRRAPAPPAQTCPQETTVQVHQEESSKLDIDADSLEDVSVEQRSPTQVRLEPGGKRSSSLGDLDNLDQKIPSLLFERAISLDLPTHLEEDRENLIPPQDRLANGDDPRVTTDHSPRIKKWIVKENLTASTESNDSNNNSVTTPSDMVEVNLEDVQAVPEPKLEEQPPTKCPEVIEITEGELDDVMMSHKQYLLKQGRSTTPLETKKEEVIGFESWSYKEDNKSQISSEQTVEVVVNK